MPKCSRCSKRWRGIVTHRYKAPLKKSQKFRLKHKHWCSSCVVSNKEYRDILKVERLSVPEWCDTDTWVNMLKEDKDGYLGWEGLFWWAVRG